jgi:hypothetical protein
LWIGKQAAINEIAQKARNERPPVVLFDLRPRHLDQLAVLDARRAGGLARAAIQTAVDMRDKRVAQLEPPLVNEQHLPNSSARRIGFLAP